MFSRRGSSCTTPARNAAQTLCDGRSEVSHARVHPIAGAGLVGKPAVDGKYHFPGLRSVVQSLGLIAQPQELVLAVTLADVHAQFNQGIVNSGVERIRGGAVRSALDGNCPLVVLSRGGTPRAVLFLHAEGNFPVLADTVVTARFPPFRETGADTLCGKLSHNTVGVILSILCVLCPEWFGLRLVYFTKELFVYAISSFLLIRMCYHWSISDRPS